MKNIMRPYLDGGDRLKWLRWKFGRVLDSWHLKILSWNEGFVWRMDNWSVGSWRNRLAWDVKRHY